LLAAYEAIAGQKAPPHPSKLILAGDGDAGESRRISFRLVLLILVGIVIGALAFWGKNRSMQQPVVTPAPVVSEPTATEPAPTLELVPPSEPAATPVATPVEQAPSTTEAAPAVTTPAAPEAAPANAIGPLLLQFSGTSWAEVKDASGRLLLSGLVEAGNSQTLDGRPPFEIVLGNAPVVRISYQGQPVDMAAYRRADNTARFTLPSR
jgi:cytoskeleton protein RodZ